MLQTDVCIIGAGPAGSICSLFLNKFGINSILVDKETFPREKICGDGISGWVVTVLEELDHELVLRLNRSDFQLPSWGVRIVAPNHKSIDVPFRDKSPFPDEVPPGFLARRVDFDNFLVGEAKKTARVQVVENTKISGFEYQDQSILLHSESQTIRAKLAVFASGIHARTGLNPANILHPARHMMTGIRAYYRGVQGCHPDNYIELHFLRDFLPGYFWIFPVKDDCANVGVGMDSRKIQKKGINLRESMLKYIETVPYLKERFANATMETKIQGYPLPVGMKRKPISGDRFMLAGDAAGLLDPATGEGMGNAAITGMFAARQATECLKHNDCSAEAMQGYDRLVYNKIWRELSTSLKIKKFINTPWLFDKVVSKSASSKMLQDTFSRAMIDLEVRKNLKKPSFYLKALLKRNS